jgi:hypothetical protein
VLVSGGDAAWDYVTFETEEGCRLAWSWVKDLGSAQPMRAGDDVGGGIGGEFTIKECGAPGVYLFRYFIEGGFLTSGSCIETLRLDVKSPVLSFTAPDRVIAGG